MNNNVVFETEKIVKRFGATLAVDSASIILYQGEIRGLVGENGSGKTTLVSIISGLLKPDSGEMLKNGKSYKPSNLIDANKLGISLIIQEMSTIDGLSIAQNIFFGDEKEFSKYGILNSKKMNATAKELLQKYGVTNVDPNLDVASLSFEQKKLIEFTKALYTNPDILIVDETSSALSQSGRKLLYEIIHNLSNSGKSVIFITHDLTELLEHCDTTTILKDGEVVGTYNSKDLDENKLKTLMVGREYKESGNYYREDSQASFSTDIVFKGVGLTKKTTFEDINFELHRGEILGIGGLTGCGMHDLGKTLFGIIKPDSGKVTFFQQGKESLITTPQKAIKNKIAFVSKNRDQESLMLTSSINDNITLPGIDSISKTTFINPKLKREYAEKNAKQLSIKMDNINQLVMYLSGGNKQKTAISKWLANESELFILDCPTRGIDISVKAAVYQLMQEFKIQGRSVIMISEELLELIGMCDRIIMMRDGKISGEVMRGTNMTEENLINCMI